MSGPTLEIVVMNVEETVCLQWHLSVQGRYVWFENGLHSKTTESSSFNPARPTDAAHHRGKTHIVFISELTGLPDDLRRFKLLSTPVGIFNGRSPLQILEFNGGLGRATCLFHDGETQDLVGFAVEFYG